MRFPKNPQNPCFWSLMISEWMGNILGPFSQTHTCSRMHSHTHASTRADEINKIAESQWRAVAKHTHIHAPARTHTHARIQTQTCGRNYGKAAAQCRWRATPKRTLSHGHVSKKKCRRNYRDSQAELTSDSKKDTITILESKNAPPMMRVRFAQVKCQRKHWNCISNYYPLFRSQIKSI